MFFMYNSKICVFNRDLQRFILTKKANYLTINKKKYEINLVRNYTYTYICIIINQSNLYIMTTLNEIHRTNLVPSNGQPSKQLNIALKNKKNFSFIITDNDRYLYQLKRVTVKELAIKYLNS